MNKGFRIAAVSFLNTIPLLEGLGDNQDDVAELILDLPSRLPGFLERGEADVGLVPVVEILRGNTGGIISPSGIACNGSVDSVMFFTAGSPADLNQVLADRGSRSSVALLKILLAELYGVRPDFVEVEPQAGRRLAEGEGMLVIGDRSFAQVAALKHTNPDNLLTYDLGLMWKELTGLPFVFAAWAASPGLVDDKGLEAACRLGEVLTAARNRGLDRLDELASEQAAMGRMGRGGEASPAAIAYYYRHSLRFELGPQEQAGIRRFQELGRIHGLIPNNIEHIWLCQGDHRAT